MIGQPVEIHTKGRPPDPAGARALACRAPFVSLHLDQFGDARACCQSDLVLGNVARESLLDIWHGKPAERQRAAIAEGDFSVGCSYCDWAIGNASAEFAYARNFDRCTMPEPGAGPSQLEMALSNSCNLQCTMCNGDFSSSIRTLREGRAPLPTVYGEAFFDDLAEVLPEVDEVHLLGGEPFLGHEPLRVMAMLTELAPNAEVTVTTNATVWTPRVEKLVDRLAMNLVVSVDGASASTYEAIRIGASWDTLMENLVRLRDAVEAKGRRLFFAHCLMVENWHEFPELLALAAAFEAEVFVNTVLTPTDSSLHLLSPPELSVVIATLEARDAEVVALGEPWLTTWNTQIERLREARDDASRGDVETYVTGGDNPLRPVGGDEEVSAESLAADPSSRVLVLDVDRDLRIAGVEVRSEGQGLPPLEPAALIGRSSRSLHDPSVIQLAHTTYRRSRSLVDDERLFRSGDQLLVDRRVYRDDGAGWFTLTVRQQRVLPESEIVTAVAADAGPGMPVVILDADSETRITGVGPSADAARLVGLAVELGTRLVTFDAIVDPTLAAPGLSVEVTGIDWITSRHRVRTPAGLDLSAWTRLQFDFGVFTGFRMFLTARSLPEVG